MKRKHKHKHLGRRSSTNQWHLLESWASFGQNKEPPGQTPNSLAENAVMWHLHPPDHCQTASSIRPHQIVMEDSAPSIFINRHRSSSCTSKKWALFKRWRPLHLAWTIPNPLWIKLHPFKGDDDESGRKRPPFLQSSSKSQVKKERNKESKGMKLKRHSKWRTKREKESQIQRGWQTCKNFDHCGQFHNLPVADRPRKSSWFHLLVKPARGRAHCGHRSCFDFDCIRFHPSISWPKPTFSFSISSGQLERSFSFYISVASAFDDDEAAG